MIFKKNKYFLFFVFLSLHSYSDYSEHPKAEYVINSLISDHNFYESEVKLILSLAETDNKILKSMTNAAEKTKTWTKYKESFVPPRGIPVYDYFFQHNLIEVTIWRRPLTRKPMQL